MGGFRDKMSRWMSGRYGTDSLNRFLMFLTFALLIISMFVKVQVLYYFSLVGLLLVYFRMFSRNFYKRNAENERFLHATAGIRKIFSLNKRKRADKAHAYFNCPSCKQTVRVPKGRGRIAITCPKCRYEFIKKT